MEKVIDRDKFRLTIPSSPKFLRVVRAILAEITHEAGFDEKTGKDIILAVAEACTNVIKHSYGGDESKKIIISFSMHDDRLEIEIRDFGKKVDPKEIQHRKLEDVKPGGLGVLFIKSSMDEVEYDTSMRHGTTLTLVKYLKTAERTFAE